MKPISQRIADNTGIGESQIQAAIRLLDEGATVPFIARYRKEVTDGLSDTHLRHIQARLVENFRKTASKRLFGYL